MKTLKIATALALASLVGNDARVLAAPPSPTVGEVYELKRSYETSERSSDGSSGSSNGHDTILEQVIALRDGGVELEYGLTENATPEERARDWKFPARVFQPSNGPMTLLNAEELERRLEGWLKSAGWDRSICGRWIFTWNAFRIDCDPQSAIDTIRAFDLRSSDVREGAAYQDADAVAPSTIVRQSITANGEVFAVTFAANPRKVQRTRAEADVATGEIMGKPVAFESALAERSKEEVSGTIAISFETDDAGAISRKTTVTKLEIKLPDGTSESRTAIETVERHLVPTPAARH